MHTAQDVPANLGHLRPGTRGTVGCVQPRPFQDVAANLGHLRPGTRGLWDAYSPGNPRMSQPIWDISDLDYGEFGFILEWYVLGLVVEWGTSWATLGCTCILGHDWDWTCLRS